MAKLGTEKRPIIVHVRTEERGRYVAEQCALRGWHYIIGFEPDKPEDISDLEKALNPPVPVQSEKVGRNDPRPFRNPYSHYNIRKITRNVIAGRVKVFNLETGKYEEKDILTEQNPTIQAVAKPLIDKRNLGKSAPSNYEE
jgi:hypothetical protein